MSTVINAPHTADAKKDTPSGACHSNPRKRMSIDSVFCALNTNNTMRNRLPTITAHHAAAMRVNLTADSGEVAWDPDAVPAGLVTCGRGGGGAPGGRPVGSTGGFLGESFGSRGHVHIFASSDAESNTRPIVSDHD